MAFHEFFKRFCQVTAIGKIKLVNNSFKKQVCVKLSFLQFFNFDFKMYSAKLNSDCPIKYSEKYGFEITNFSL